MAPLLLPAGVTVLVDRRLVEAADEVGYAPTGDPGTAVALRLRDVVALSGAKPVELLARATAPVPESSPVITVGGRAAPH